METQCPAPDLKQTLTLWGHDLPLGRHHHQEADLISRTATLAALILATLGIVAAPVLAASPGAYPDPKGRFVLAVPPDTQVTKKGDGSQVAIEARQGYRITLQTSPSNGAVSLSDMARKLEARHLGPFKIWRVKLGERATSVGDLPALEMGYEGSGTRVRVFIMRGRKTDFVFMFFAAPRIFDEMVTNFDWVLQNFQLASDELPSGQTASGQAAPKPAPPQATPSAERRFADRELGYAIDYPGDWMMEKPTAFSTVFSGQQGTEAYYATVRIQNVKPQAANDPKQAMGRRSRRSQGQAGRRRRRAGLPCRRSLPLRPPRRAPRGAPVHGRLCQRRSAIPPMDDRHAPIIGNGDPHLVLRLPRPALRRLSARRRENAAQLDPRRGPGL